MNDLCNAVKQAQADLSAMYSIVLTIPSCLANITAYLSIQRTWLGKAKLHEDLAERLQGQRCVQK